MKRVLVTGAGGFIGRHVLAPLAERGYDVHAITRQTPPSSDDAWTWHRADLLDLARLQPLMHAVQPTHLLHLAWYAVPGQYWTAPENFQWVQASLELLRRFHEVEGGRVVMAGTCAEYDWRYGYCSESVTPTAPATPYGVCKLALQTMLDAYAGGNGLSSAWGRVFFLYGPHEHPSRLISSVARALLRGEPAPCSHGRQVRDFLYVADVADAFAALLDSDVTGPVNIAAGQPVTIRDVVYRLADKVGRRDLIRLDAVAAAPSEPRLLCADTRRLFDEVGWSPRYDLDAGLDGTIRWWQGELAQEQEQEKEASTRTMSCQAGG